MNCMHIWAGILLLVSHGSAETRIVNGRQIEEPEKATVVFKIVDSIGQKRASSFTVYDGNRKRIGSPEFDASDFKQPSHFCRLLRERENPLALILLNRFNQDLKDGIELYETGEHLDPEVLDQIAEALNALLPGPVIFDPGKFPDIHVSARNFDFQSVVNIEANPENRMRLMAVNRMLIEAALPNQFAQCQAVLSSEDGVASVDPGAYWFVSNDNPELMEHAAIKPGKTNEIVVRQSHSLWLEFALEYGKPAKKYLFIPQSRHQMRQTLSYLRFPKSDSSHFSIKSFVLRPNVGPDPLDQARRAALDLLPELIQQIGPPNGSSNQEIIEFFDKRKSNIDSCQKILAVAGQSQDAELIAKLLNLDCNTRELHAWAATIARIDARQDRAGFWNLKRLLNHSDDRWKMAAGIQLHLAGLSDGDQTLHRFISNPSILYLGYEPTLAMLDSTDPATLVAMRSYLRRCLTYFEKQDSPGLYYITWPSCIYLLVHGDDEDWQMVSQARFAIPGVFTLSFLADDPIGTARILMERGRGIDRDLVRRIGTGFRDSPRDEAHWLQQQLFAELSKSYTLRFEGIQANRAAMEIDEENELFSSFYLPSSEVVRKLGGFGPHMTRFDPQPNRGQSLLQRTPWLPQSQHVDTYIDNWLNGHASYLSQLDYLTTQAIQDSVERRGNKRTPTAYPLFLLQHQIGTTAWSTSMDNFPMGKERRSYLLIHNSEPGNPGGLNGVAELSIDFERPEGLEFRIQLIQETHYAGGAIFGQRVDDWSTWPHHKYVLNSGRDLIHSIKLRNIYQDVDATFVGQDPGGTLTYRVKVPESVSSDWYLDINLGFVDQRKTVTFCLSSCENARSIRRKIDQSLNPRPSNQDSQK